MSLKVEKINNRWYVNGEPSKTPRVDDLKKQFDELNEAYFGGALPPCRMFCTTSPDRLAALCIPSQKEIVFNRNWRYIWTASLIRKVLIHEMIHLHIHYKYKKVGRWLNSFHHMWPFAYEWWKLNWKYHLGLKLLEPLPIKGISKGT
jgi:hypothetical protein